METYLVYCDETGDDGLIQYSSDHFVLTSIYMPAEKWQTNFDIFRDMRRQLKADFGLHIKEEFHTRQFLTDKNPYRKYGWTFAEKREIIKRYTIAVSSLELKCINVIIDKTKVKQETYPVLENALTYSIQRIENDSNKQWKYVIVSDKGRVGAMNRAARKIRSFNPIPSMFGEDYRNQPIKNMVEDILEKDSQESYFIQICDFISYFAHLYFTIHDREKSLPNRVLNVIDAQFVGSVFATLKESCISKIKTPPTTHSRFQWFTYSIPQLPEKASISFI